MPMAFEPPPTHAVTASGSAPVSVEHLLARLLADDLLEVAHHRGERVRARDRAEDVVGGLDVRDPVAHGLVDRVLQGARARRDGDHLGAEQAHAGDVERLALGVDLAHVDRAVEAEEGRRGGGGDAVLARAGLGDDARLADALREQRLAEHVVDLVRAGVVEVFALQDDAGAAGVRGEARHLGDDRRPAGVAAAELGELGLERRVELRRARRPRASSSRAATRDSGTKRPPKSPKYGPVCALSAMSHRQEAERLAIGSPRDERLADEHDVGAGRAVVRDVVGREHRRLRDADRVVGESLGEAAEQVAVELEGREVAGVDADERARRVAAARSSSSARVRLDERRSCRARRRGRAARASRASVERGDDEQHEVGAGGARLEHLVRRRR